MGYGHLHTAIAHYWEKGQGDPLPPLAPLDAIDRPRDLEAAYGEQLGRMLTCTLLAAHDAGEASLRDACATRLAELSARRNHLDSLTGLLDHAASWEAFAREHALALRSNRPLALALLDLAHFKVVNDTLGHLNGDQLLVRVAQLLASNVRQTDIVGRVGGDEFLVVLVDAGREAAERLVAKLHAHVAPMHEARVVPPSFALSWGIDDSLNGGPREMFQRAERRLYGERGRQLQSEPLTLPRLHVLVSMDERSGEVRELLGRRGYRVSDCSLDAPPAQLLRGDVIVADVHQASDRQMATLAALSRPLVLLGWKGQLDPPSIRLDLHASGALVADAVDGVLS